MKPVTGTVRMTCSATITYYYEELGGPMHTYCLEQTTKNHVEDGLLGTDFHNGSI